MKSKKGIVSICICVLLALGSSLAYAWNVQNAAQKAFAYSGYILNADAGQKEKKVLFAADAAWREYEDDERKKRRCAEGRMRERPPSSMSKRDSCG